ncbi:MAG: D-tyrosyl-tRNA(Tyr) deacylase [Clostridia bacterium]|nr:D-tyrosyl-tRNA(Tyr) deacylase [Clostridia bacterium]
MYALVQRTGKTSLYVGGALVSEIPSGLVLYLGVKEGDTDDMPAKVARKVSGLRIFSDDAGKMNLSVKDAGGEILLVSQFTLCGNLSKGNRPDFSSAEKPDRARKLYEMTRECLEKEGLIVKTGVFGADMQIDQHNDGPVTVMYEI